MEIERMEGGITLNEFENNTIGRRKKRKGKGAKNEEGIFVKNQGIVLEVI